MALLPESVKSGAKLWVPRLVIFSPGYADQSWENSLQSREGPLVAVARGYEDKKINKMEKQDS